MTNGRAPPSTKAKIVQFTRGAAVLAAAALVTGGLTACGEDEPVDPSSSSTVSPLPGNSTTGSSSSSTTSSSSAASSDSSGSSSDLPDDLPEAAKEETKEGAAAFGKYYYLKMADADHTGDTTDLATLGLDTCPPCAQSIKDIDADAKKGQTRSANPYRITNVESVARPDEGFKVSMDVDVKAHHVYKDGEVIGDVEARQYKLTEHVVWSDGRWQISDWVIS